jgi:hypothetical protein
MHVHDLLGDLPSIHCMIIESNSNELGIKCFRTSKSSRSQKGQFKKNLLVPAMFTKGLSNDTAFRF